MINTWKSIQLVCKSKIGYIEKVIKKTEPLLIKADTNLNVLCSACNGVPHLFIEQWKMYEAQKQDHLKKLKKLKEAYMMIYKKKSQLDRSRSQSDMKSVIEEGKNTHI